MGFPIEEPWLFWDDYEMTVDGAWSSMSGAGSAMEVIKEKTKGCREILFA